MQSIYPPNRRPKDLKPDRRVVPGQVFSILDSPHFTLTFYYSGHAQTSLTRHELSNLAGRSGAIAEATTHQKGNCFIPKSEYSGVYQLARPVFAPNNVRRSCHMGLLGVTSSESPDFHYRQLYPVSTGVSAEVPGLEKPVNNSNRLNLPRLFKLFIHK